MKERPIIFKGEMVRAIREGRKSQTRRVIKPQPRGTLRMCTDRITWQDRLESNSYLVKVYGELKCPYGQAGDRLWVRETWYTDNYRQNNGLPILYRADGDLYHWKPSIFMPRWASRIDLELTADPYPQRVQEITPWDIVAEGCPFHLDDEDGSQVTEWFADLWDSIHGEGAWERNDWVWKLDWGKNEILPELQAPETQ